MYVCMYVCGVDEWLEKDEKVIIHIYTHTYIYVPSFSHGLFTQSKYHACVCDIRGSIMHVCVI